MGSGLKYLFDLLLVLNDMDPAANKTRQRLTGAVLSVLVLAVITIGLWAKGWVPSVAIAAEVTKQLGVVEARQDEKRAAIEKKQDRLALVVLKQSIRTTLTDRCNALRRRNQEALDAANVALDDLTDQFLELARRPPDIPDCRVVLIDSDAR